jgi:hypothetical protein
VIQRSLRELEQCGCGGAMREGKKEELDEKNE